MKNYTPIEKFYACCIALLFFMMPCFGQNVAINEDGSLPNPKAILDIKSYSKGILIPRMSSNDRLAIQAPTGLLVFDTTTRSFWYGIWYDSMTVWKNLVPGAGWGVQGNIADSNYYLGTDNRIALKIKVDAVASGCIDPVSRNTYWGYMAGYMTPLYRLDTTGTGNTGIGSLSLRYNFRGSFNTATGNTALLLNTSGSSNTATGTGSLYSNTFGNSNTANGSYALHLNTGGGYNTAVGGIALNNNRNGSYNTGIGYNTSVSRDSLSNATAIGYGAVVNASNKVRIGNSTVLSIEGAVPFTVVSDGRFKYSVKEDVKGLDFILQLRPVTYQFDVKRFDAQFNTTEKTNEGSPENYAMPATYYNEAISQRRSGFIAQEVEKAANKAGYDFSGIIKPQTSGDHYSLSYESFVVPMVKAIQELNEKNKKLEQEIELLKQLLQKLK